MPLVIVAAKNLKHAFSIVEFSPQEMVKEYILVENDGIQDFLFDHKEFFTNYDIYYKFDPYMDICLEKEDVQKIIVFAYSILEAISKKVIQKSKLIIKYHLTYKKINEFALGLIRISTLALEKQYTLVGLGD